MHAFQPRLPGELLKATHKPNMQILIQLDVVLEKKDQELGIL